MPIIRIPDASTPGYNASTWQQIMRGVNANFDSIKSWINNPTVPTAPPGDDSDKAASTEFVDVAIAAAVTTIDGDLATIAGEISTIDGQITTINGQISTIGGEITALQHGISTLSGRNRLINGDFRVSQYNGASAVTPATPNSYPIDRWFASNSVVSKLTYQQSANGSLAPSALALGVSTAVAYAVTAGEYFYIAQSIEANNIGDFDWGAAGAKAVSLSFWVYSSLTGTFGGGLRNYAGNRSYPFTYSIPVANTWTKIVITIPGDTSGTWVLSGRAGALMVQFGLGVGATYSGTAGAWSGGNYVSATGAVSVVATLGATWLATDIQLELAPAGATSGSPLCTPFERKLFGQVLAECMWYYQSYIFQTSQIMFTGMCLSSSVAEVPFQFQVPMRAAPTAILPSAGSGSGQAYLLTATGTIPSTIGSMIAGRIDPTMCRLDFGGWTSAFVAGNATQLTAGSPAGCVFGFSAEI